MRASTAAAASGIEDFAQASAGVASNEDGISALQGAGL